MIGYIYGVYCKDETITDFYIGSTNNHKKRYISHKTRTNNKNDKHYNQKIYKFIRGNGNIDNYNFIIIENYKYNNEKELRMRENYWINFLKPTLNQIKSYLSKEDLENYNKNWRYSNFGKEWKKNYRKVNADKIKDKNKQYYIDNADKINETAKQYNIDNTDKIKKRYNCECGGKYTYGTKSTHFKTKKHQKYLATLN